MGGYTQDPLQTINLIADNLRDRYKSGFPVLKEIIQNADDAGITHHENIGLEYGLSPGLSKASHPLLQGPALFFINDGSFSPSDSIAIRSFGLNQKAIDEATIGKFGLGMKSVFHFCEAFFFIARSNGRTYEDIINPWSVPTDALKDFTPVHNDWDNFIQDDANKILEQLGVVLRQMKSEKNSLFLLWIPLRQKKHLIVNGKEVGNIAPEFPGDDLKSLAFLDPGQVVAKLAELFPMLRSTERIRYWRPTQLSHQFETDFTIALKQGAQRIKYPKTVTESDVKGVVQWEDGKNQNQKYELKFSGKEKQLTLASLEKLRGSDFWPKSFVRDANKIGQKAPDKAKAHCAAIFSFRKNENFGSLKIGWAVFLPVDTAFEEIPLKGNLSFRLTLHGYFFVDAGRTEIFGLREDSLSDFPDPENENQLRTQWNVTLAKQGTLPLILPAVQDFIKTARLSHEDVSDLCEAIRSSKLFIHDKGHICRDYNLICRLRPEGQKWELVPKDQLVLTLPAPPAGDPNRPWDVFGKLKEIEGRFLLINNASPHLMRDPNFHGWNAQLLIEAMDIDEKIVFQKQILINYFKEFLDVVPVRNLLNEPEVRKHLIRILNRAFVKAGANLSSLKSKVQEIVSFIKPQFRLPITQGHPDVIDPLRRCDINVLLVPKEFDSNEEPGKAVLFLSDAVSLFREIDILVTRFEKHNHQEKLENCRVLSRQILDHCPSESKAELCNLIQDFRILDAFDCSNNRRTALSISQIKQSRENGTLFLFSQGVNETQRQGLSTSLQKIICDHIFLINADTAKFALGNIHGIAPCDDRGCLHFLGHRVNVLQDDIIGQEELLKALAGVELNNPVLIKGMRYLLHGRAEKFEDTGSLWTSGYRQQAVWEKIWRQLPSSGNDNWNLLRRNRIDLIPQNKWMNLGIHEIKASDILKEMKSVGVNTINPQVFDEKERDEVLVAMEDDKDLWQKIPFHKTLSNELVPISWDNTFLESDICLPLELQSSVKVICRSSNHHVLRRQQEYIQPLNEANVIGILLNSEQPYRYWLEIMNVLQQAGSKIEPNYKLKKELKEKKWLVDRNNCPVCPADVIHLEKLQDEVSRLIALNTGAYCDPLNLHESIRKHPYFLGLMDGFFSKEDDGLQTLCLLIGDRDDYAIGEIGLEGDVLEKIIYLLKDIPSEIEMPGWNLLEKISEAYGLEKCERFLLDDMKKPISLKKTIALLTWLTEQHKKASFPNRSNIKMVFDRYLSVFAKRNDSQSYIRQLELLNRKQEWRPSYQLCIDVQGVDSSHILDQDQKRILKALIAQPAKKREITALINNEFERDVYASVKETGRTLKKFFSAWDGLIEPEIICAFLCLLGDDPQILKLADEYKGRHSIQWIRENLSWGAWASGSNDTWLVGLSSHEAFEKHRFIVKIVSGDMVEVISLIGEPIMVSLDNDIRSLLVGSLWYEKPKDLLIFPKIHLRQLDLEKYSPEQLTSFLRISAEILLKDFYNQGNYNLENLWNELDKSDQLDIQIARRLIMKHIPLYLRQLGIHQHPRLSKEIHKWNEARYRIEEFSNKPEKKKEFEDQETESLENIQNLIKGDAEIQNVIREAVRNKVGDFQYTPASIPFELFQNADDAVSELQSIKGSCDVADHEQNSLIPSFVRRFIIEKGQHHLTFMHWGRPVNYMGGGGFPGRERGFHQDLEKMLVLSSSDKQSGDSVTGKFGLGFKSVLLACDTPHVISGRLKVKIIAGLFPEKLHINETNLNQRLLTEYPPDAKWPGTLIHLPEIKNGLDDICGPFETLSGIMTVFAKQIRQVEIVGPDGIIVANEWQPSSIASNSDVSIEMGSLNIGPTKQQNSAGMLYFRCKSGGLLTEIGPKGFRHLPANIPGIWVVAPTQEKGGIGFAINGDFEIDVGRSRLASNSQSNKTKAEHLGRFISKGLDMLFQEAEQDWDGLCHKLKLEHGLSKYDFWFSVWNVLTNEWVNSSPNEVTEIAKHALTGGSGLGRFVDHQPAMPNGLWGKFYKRLTKPYNVRYVLRDTLTNESIFNHISEWPVFRNKIPPESVISEPVYTVLRKICPSFAEKSDHWQSLRLNQVISWLDEEEDKVHIETAEILGLVVKPALFTEMNKTESGQNEARQIYKVLARLKFKTRDGEWATSQNLLIEATIPGGNEDEPKRAAFAPDDQVLSVEYQSDGITFFMACREKLTAPVNQMLEWVIAAASATKRINALQYLSEGELAHNLSEMLRQRGIVGTWLSELTRDSTYFHGWNDTDIDELIYRKLKPIETLRPPQPLPRPNPIDPLEALPKIYLWWDEEHEIYEKRYCKDTYPEGRPPDLKMGDDGNFDRGAWLSLFLLGAFHTMGRTRQYQHKGFLELCQKRGWWKTFTQKSPQKHADDWMRILEDYINEQIDENEYEIWMNRFPTIYRFSRELDEYVEAFYSINRNGTLNSLDDVLMSRSSPGYQGGGISAPPIKKTLGIGANFVVREMKRAGILSNNGQVSKFCYVPTSRVRHMLGVLGCNELNGESASIDQSKIIHEFLCDNIGVGESEFKGAFDIPLQFVAENTELQIKLLGRELDYNS